MNDFTDIFAEVPAVSDTENTRPPAPPPPPLPTHGEGVPLGDFASRAYLEYALAVVKGRALPDVRDGLKPVQRRILHAMNEMGLTATSKPVKSARVVGDVIGKYHPHGDTAVYDAMVRTAQDFSLRYPLVDGQGNFGSRDGDSAAAMRYTEARITQIATLLLSELNMGTVDFRDNYDGAFSEPISMPARLPFVLLNGASGIAVGMATEIPSHNLREVSAAAIALPRDPSLGTSDVMQFIPGPDYPGGGQIISPANEIAQAYETGRGTLRVRAKWAIEDLARGHWQLVVSELPPNISTQKVLSEIESLTNPQIKSGKKTLDQDQAQMKSLLLASLDRVRDESGKEAAVRLVLEPKSSKQDPEEFASLLLAHTSLEATASLNMVMIGIDGRPRQKSLVKVLGEWCQYRTQTVRKRLEHRAKQVDDRIHILEGRMVVFLNIDEVIRIIRQAEDPKVALIERFDLSDRQADDILEIRLRQLARLEGIRIEQELAKLRDERESLSLTLSKPELLRDMVIGEIEGDTAKFGDDRRTLIEEAVPATGRGSTPTVLDEPVTVILSAKGWIRTRQGHGIDAATLPFKDGDNLMAAIECRTVDTLVAITNTGRALSIPASALPDGRGMGAPLASFIEIPSGAKVVHVLRGSSADRVLIATSAGFGFTCRFGDLVAQKRAGKQFITVPDGASILTPRVFNDAENTKHVLLLSSNDRLLLCPTEQIKELSGGGKGVILMGVDDNEQVTEALPCGSNVKFTTKKRGGDTVENRFDCTFWIGSRARKGKPAPTKSEIVSVKAD